MPNIRKPRRGSLQFWPRKRARRIRVRSWPKKTEAKLLGFAGYKVGMTHIAAKDNSPNSLTKNTDIVVPTTIIECPPIKAASIRFYKNDLPVSQIFAENLDKDLKRRIAMPKNRKAKEPGDYDDITLIVHTQPRITGIGKKKPEMMEIALGGKKEDKIKYAKSMLGKEIKISDIFKEGEQLDFHTITKGKGFQGPVKRFGIGLKSHRAEKNRRNPGSLGPWCGQGHIMWKVPHAGKMGHHLRTEYNKWLLKIGAKPEEINPKGGHIRYGLVKTDYLLVKGSVGGPKKGLVKFNHTIRGRKNIPKEAPQISYTRK